MALLRAATSGDIGPVLETNRVLLRAPQMSDYPAWAELRAASQDFLVPWEPLWAPDELSRSSFRRRISSGIHFHVHGPVFPNSILTVIIGDQVKRCFPGRRQAWCRRWSSRRANGTSLVDVHRWNGTACTFWRGLAKNHIRLSKDLNGMILGYFLCLLLLFWHLIGSVRLLTCDGK